MVAPIWDATMMDRENSPAYAALPLSAHRVFAATGAAAVSEQRVADGGETTRARYGVALGKVD